nr:hypothetical protein CTI12_AA002510 [Tanacetum cinerariifolium]
MDVWLGAVVAGAGYIAQHFKKVKQGDVQIVSESSVGGSVDDRPDSSKPPLEKKWSFRRSSRRECMNKDGSEDKSDASTSEVDGENWVNLGNYATSLLPGFMGSDGILGDVDMGDLVNKPSTLRSRMPLRKKLNRLLEQKENLVLDLEDEIKMKDSLVMHELIIDDHKSQGTDEQSPDGENEESVVMKTKDDSFSKIEAELEAELEMLELNMTSSLERRISNLVELDPDFEPDVAQGELRADMLENTNQGERGSSSTTTIPSANYTVSPRELSLRLHEVLQFQLEERIKELEGEIESKRIQDHISWKDFSSSDAGDDNTTDEPVVLNLSGEALDAYNEACNVLAKLDESDEDGTPIYQMEDDGSRNSAGTGGNEIDSDEDEMEKLLIKHIVEKARQGSPAILNAQRVLFSE